MTNDKHRREFLATTAATAIAGLAGCTGGTGGNQGTPTTEAGGGATATPFDYGGGDGGTPEPSMGTEYIPSDVLQQANEEGEVIVYGAIDEPDLLDPIKPTFEERFSEITMRPTGLGVNEIASKLTTERRAGNVSSDVAIFGGGTTRAIADRGVYREPPQDHWLKQQAGEMGYPEGYWSRAYEFPGYGLPYTLLYNTSKTSESEAPDTWEDLGDDTWRGDMGIVMEHPALLDAMGGLFATLWEAWGAEKWERVVSDIMDNEPQLITGSSSQAYRVMVQGERALSPNYINDLVGQIAAGEEPPAATKWPEPSLQLHVPQHLTADAPHPNAALVFVSWFMSEEGQQTIGNTGRTPVHGPTAASHDLFQQVIPEGVTIRPEAFNNPTYQGESYLENPEAFQPLLEEHFGSTGG